MSPRIGLLLVPVFVMAVLTPATAQDAERLFMGQRRPVAATGDASYNALTSSNQTLKLRGAGNVISSVNGKCSGPMQADRTFGAHGTMPSGAVSSPRGKITGSTITLHTKYVSRAATCDYDTVLLEVK
jgi:hypothetical protein